MNNLLIFIIVYLVISNEISVYTPCVLVPKTCPASGSICGQSSMAVLLITLQVLWFTHSNKISTVQFGIQLCHTDPRLSCSFSTLNPRADIDRWDFHSVRLFTVEIWLE